MPKEKKRATQNDLNRIVAAIREGDSFLVTSHMFPDGDAIGSVLAMECLLRAMGKREVVCVHESAVPRTYEFLPGVEHILKPEQVLSMFDIAILLDTAQRARAGEAESLFNNCARLVVIDHHLDDAPQGDVNFVDASYAATGEIMAELFDAAGVPISKTAAEYLYVALATDTGSFRFSNTSPRCLRTAARLVDTGFDVSAISTRVFDMMSRPKFGLLARMSGRVRFLHGGKVAYTEITKGDMEESGAREGDIEGLINFPRYVEGVELAILVKEMDGREVKASFRGAHGINCAKIAAHFGGGGHEAAAGATLDVPLSQARTRVLEYVDHLFGDSH